jgi:EpsI family protein
VGPRAAWQRGLVVLGCLLPIALGPTLLHAMVSQTLGSAPAGGSIRLPTAASGWSGPDAGSGTWTPSFSGATYEERGSYLDATGKPVDVFVGEYLIGDRDGREMIAYGNYVVPRERESLLPERRAELSLGSDARLTVREITIRDALGVRVVWLWYRVGSHTTVSGWGAKLLEGLEFLRRQGATERVISIAAQAGDREAALDRLNEFARANAACMAAGFEPSGCAD